MASAALATERIGKGTNGMSKRLCVLRIEVLWGVKLCRGWGGGGYRSKSLTAQAEFFWDCLTLENKGSKHFRNVGNHCCKNIKSHSVMWYITSTLRKMLHRLVYVSCGSSKLYVWPFRCVRSTCLERKATFGWLHLTFIYSKRKKWKTRKQRRRKSTETNLINKWINTVLN
jgi:hypothetical protein